MNKPKPVVHYREHDINSIVLGLPARLVHVYDHPILGSRNTEEKGGTIWTSTVTRVRPDGRFETLNTTYVPRRDSK